MSAVYSPADIGLFYVDPDDPEAGGTGHTIRVCRLKDVPVITQDIFLKFMSEGRAPPFHIFRPQSEKLHLYLDKK